MARKHLPLLPLSGRLALFALLLAPVGCGTTTDIVACSVPGGCASGAQCVSGQCVPNGDLGPTPDLGGAGDGGLGGFCAGSGPLVIPNAGTGISQCTGQLAENAFRFAVCSCGEFTVSNTFFTDSFDSARGAYVEAEAGDLAAFGTNGAVALSSDATIRGSVRVADAAGISGDADASLDVGGELRVGGPVDLAGPVSIALDADVSGDVSATDLTIGGTLTQPGGASVTATTQSIGGQASGVVDVTHPCACGDDAAIDPAALVASFSTLNDNIEAGFDPAALDGYGDGARVELPCGRLYAPAMSGTGALTLHVRGRTALFVAGDFVPTGDFAITLEPGAELDLFIAGNLASASRLDLGSSATPSRVRLYVGGSQPIALSGGGVFAGFVYAPNARFTMSTAIEIYGGLFASGIVASDTLTVHYDESILESASDCDPPTECAGCGDCRGQACVGGSCGSCTVDSDCCAPYACFDGTCEPPFG